MGVSKFKRQKRIEAAFAAVRSRNAPLTANRPETSSRDDDTREALFPFFWQSKPMVAIDPSRKLRNTQSQSLARTDTPLPRPRCSCHEADSLFLIALNTKRAVAAPRPSKPPSLHPLVAAEGNDACNIITPTPRARGEGGGRQEGPLTGDPVGDRLSNYQSTLFRTLRVNFTSEGSLVFSFSLFPCTTQF